MRGGQLRQARAMAWLHLVRTSRYVYSMANWAVVDGLWITIYVLGALTFASPESYPTVAPLVFWAVLAWGLMSTPTWTIGNWARFYVAMGVFEEHELAGASHSLFLAMRSLPAVAIGLGSAAVVGAFVSHVAGVPVARAENPALLAASLLAITVMATLYSLVLAFLSLATRAPAPLLDFVNFLLFIVGGIAAPVSRLPHQLRLVALATPYSHPAELMRLAAVGLRPYLPAGVEAALTLAWIALMAAAWLAARTWALRLARREGVRGIGRM
ncbi:MAG: ABC transporter permease [Desulfurococcales archaeon]|nr:ABC transporter permease [Desulfurococcales archaeon]